MKARRELLGGSVVLLLSAGCGASTVGATDADRTAPSASEVPASASVALASSAPAPIFLTLERAWTLCDGPESLPLEVAGSREFVTVTLPGAKSSEPLRFLVDTGGSTRGLTIRGDVARRLGFTSADQLPDSMLIGDRQFKLPGGASWFISDDKADKFDQSTRKDWAAGQLGAGFLSRYVVCIDPGKGKIGLGDPAHYHVNENEQTWVPLFLLPGGDNHALYPFVHLILQHQGKFIGGYGVLLDTGATNSMLDRGKITYQEGHTPDLLRAEGAFGDADMISGNWGEQMVLVDDVVLNTPTAILGELHLPKANQFDLGPARFIDRSDGTWSQMFGDVKVTMGSHGAIANDVLLRHKLLIDYPQGRLFVQPSGYQAGPSSSSSTVGVAVVYEGDGCPVIRQLTKTNAKSTSSKLAIGDVIVSVDGNDTCKAQHHELAAWLAGPPGTKRKLEIRRGGKVSTVEVETAELLRP